MKFQGAAFWRLSTSDGPGWLSRAHALVKPLEEAGFVASALQTSPTGGRLDLSFGSECFSLSVVNNRGNGTVRKAVATPRFLLVLVALRTALGDLEVVDDNQETIPTRPRPTYELFKEDWDCVERMASILGLTPDERFRHAHARVLNGLI